MEHDEVNALKYENEQLRCALKEAQERDYRRSQLEHLKQLTFEVRDYLRSLEDPHLSIVVSEKDVKLVRIESYVPIN
jgi:hypothetical protein